MYVMFMIYQSNIQSLIDGYNQFKHKYSAQNSQKPKAMFIACCDSRINPAIITNCDPGDLFVVRNIANLVPPFSNDTVHHSINAALKFGITNLNINNIIVLGHSHCGGINSLMDNNHDAWMEIARPAKQEVLTKYPDHSPEEQKRLCEQTSLIMSLNNLKTFPWIKERVLANELFLHAWYFDLATGVIKTYDLSCDKFTEL
jgi:carbonic anhydrase